MDISSPLSSKLNRRKLLQVGGGLIAGSLMMPKLVLAKGSLLQADRSLNLYNVHTGEFFKEVFWAEGQYVAETLKKANHFLRDWRTGQIIAINQELLSLLHLLGQKLDTKKPFEIFCGYRSPKTNAKLRSHNKGVAKHSRHITGKAVDFHIPKVRLRDLRNAAVAAKKGGVGYYPRSGFVHVDIRKSPATW